MHPIFANGRRLAIYLLSWLPIAAVMTSILNRAAGLPGVESFLIAGPMCLVYAFMCLASWYVCRAAPLGRRSAPAILGTITFASLLSSGFWVLLGWIWVSALGNIPDFPEVANRYADQAALLFMAGVLLFLLALCLHYLLVMLEESRAAEKRALESMVLAREAELRALRSQIDPHFLFNSLNSISALAIADPAGARRMCILLADFMRKALKLGSRTEITFEEELDLTRGFLDIEKVRFGNRLTAEYNVEPECGACLVPPLIIQPLVENAVTHGIGPLVDGGSVRIEAVRRGESLEIILENPYDVELPPKDGTSLGIRNVRERLTNTFAGGAQVEVTRREGRFRVGLRLPCVRDGAPR